MTARTAIQLLALLTASAAQAVTLSTPPLHPDPGGRLACTVINVGHRSLAIQAGILSDVAGANADDVFAGLRREEMDGFDIVNIVR